MSGSDRPRPQRIAWLLLCAGLLPVFGGQIATHGQEAQSSQPTTQTEPEAQAPPDQPPPDEAEA